VSRFSGDLSDHFPVFYGGVHAQLANMSPLVASLGNPRDGNGGSRREKPGYTSGPNYRGDRIDLHLFIGMLCGIAGGAIGGCMFGLGVAWWRGWLEP
jgi:hypothetical protein